MTAKIERLPNASTMSVPLVAYVILSVSVAAGSVAAILIRFAQGAGVPNVGIVAWRLGLSTLLLTPVVLLRHREELRALNRRDVLLAILAGFWLGLHFILFAASLTFTSVLIAMLLVRSDPIWVPLLEWLFLREVPTRLVISGLVVTLCGGVIIALASAVGNNALVAGRAPLLGGALAVGGAMTLSAYMVIGRSVRPKIDIIPYLWIVYGTAAIVAMITAIGMHTPLAGYSRSGYFWVIMVTLVPQLLGHSSLNFSLRHFTATYVGLSGQLQIVGSTLLAAVLFAEIPTRGQLLGALLIITGIILATLGQRK